MKVLIVARTRMSQGCCVGAYSLETGENLRLLTETGNKLPENAEYQIGDIWDISFEKRQNIIPPHVEDVLVMQKSYVSKQDNLCLFLKETVPIWKGEPDQILEKKVHFPIGHSGYIDGKHGLPSQSVGFWEPERDLELTIFQSRRHYFYFDVHQVYVFPYVGYVPVIEKIPKGSLIRISLARWWTPDPAQEARSYCQMSGWYIE